MRLMDLARSVQSLKGKAQLSGCVVLLEGPPHGIHRSGPIVFRVRPVLGRQKKQRRRPCEPFMVCTNVIEE